MTNNYYTDPGGISREKGKKKMRTIINYYEYKKLRENGATTHLHNIKSNIAETINYAGEIYSLDLFLLEHGYNWKQYAGGQDWLYRSESGQELCVEIR